MKSNNDVVLYLMDRFHSNEFDSHWEAHESDPYSKT